MLIDAVVIGLFIALSCCGLPYTAILQPIATILGACIVGFFANKTIMAADNRQDSALTESNRMHRVDTLLTAHSDSVKATISAVEVSYSALNSSLEIMAHELYPEVICKKGQNEQLEYFEKESAVNTIVSFEEQLRVLTEGERNNQDYYIKKLKDEGFIINPFCMPSFSKRLKVELGIEASLGVGVDISCAHIITPDKRR